MSVLIGPWRQFQIRQIEPTFTGHLCSQWWMRLWLHMHIQTYEHKRKTFDDVIQSTNFRFSLLQHQPQLSWSEILIHSWFVLDLFGSAHYLGKKGSICQQMNEQRGNLWPNRNVFNVSWSFQLSQEQLITRAVREFPPKESESRRVRIESR